MAYSTGFWNNTSMGIFLALLLIGISLVSGQPAKTPPSPLFRLELQPPPAKRVEEQGRGFIVTCRFPDGANGSNLRWTDGKTGQEINGANGKRLGLSKRPSADKPTSIVLIFDNVTTENAGLYTCLANIDGSAEEVRKDFELLVYEGINHDNVKLRQTADINTDFLMTCPVAGNPSPTISWGRGAPIPSHGTEKYKISSEGLTIRGVTREDEGQYDCDATQMVGNVTSNFKRKAITLVVNYPPSFKETEPTVHHSFLGGEVNLTCQADGEPEPGYEWGYYQDGNFIQIPIHDLKDHRVFANPARTYILKNMSDSSEFRQFACRAQNPLGDAIRRYNVTEVDQPGPPIIRIMTISGHQVQIHVTPNDTIGGPLATTGYRALIRKTDSGGWENATVIDFLNGTMHIVDSLSHNTRYDVILASRNSVGLGRFTETISLQTLPASGGAPSLSALTALCILLCGILFWQTPV